MADITRKITLTQKSERTGDYFLVEYSTDCVNYTQSIDCTNLYLPSVNSVGYCTVDLDTSCIRLTLLGAGCGNSVIEDLNPTPTTTTTTTTTTSTTTTSTTTTAAPTTTTTTTLEPTTTTTTLEPTTTTTSTTSTTTTTLQPVWYSLYNCLDGTTQYSTQKTAGTFVVNERVTFGGAFWYVIAELTSNPGGSLIDVVSAGGPGVTGCPTTTTTTTTTTAAPLLVSNGSITCIGNLGTFTSTFSGGSGTYSYTAIADSQANASNAVQGISGTRYAVTGNTYEWASIANGTYYVAVLDSVGTVSVQNTPVVINCTTTTTTTTTTTAAPITSACYTLETVQSSQGECFDCPGYFASTTDTVMKIFTECSGSEIFPPFDIFVESRYSDNSTSSLFIPAGYTSSIIIATSDVQCVAPPTCGEIASPTFVSASITSPSGSITECCVTPPTTTTTTAGTTTTTTTTTTAAPISSTFYDVIVDQTDLDDATGNTDPGKNDGTVYVDYTNSSGNPATAQYGLAGTFTNSICVETLTTPTIYYYKNNLATVPMGSSVSDTSTSC